MTFYPFAPSGVRLTETLVDRAGFYLKFTYSYRLLLASLDHSFYFVKALLIHGFYFSTAPQNPLCPLDLFRAPVLFHASNLAKRGTGELHCDASGWKTVSWVLPCTKTHTWPKTASALYAALVLCFRRCRRRLSFESVCLLLLYETSQNFWVDASSGNSETRERNDVRRNKGRGGWGVWSSRTMGCVLGGRTHLRGEWGNLISEWEPP